MPDPHALTVFPAEHWQTPPCACCGQPTRIALGRIADGDGPVAEYEARWTPGHPEDGIGVMVRLAPGLEARVAQDWQAEPPDHPVAPVAVPSAVALRARFEGAGQLRYRLENAVDGVWAHFAVPPGWARRLALAARQTPASALSYACMRTLVRDDPRVAEFVQDVLFPAAHPGAGAGDDAPAA